MVIQENMESKKYIVVKNHVREITDKEIGSVSVESEEKVKKSEKTTKKKNDKKQQTSSEDDHVNINEISKSDLKELKTVYKKCKAVLRNIESKYGHLLNLDGENEIGSNNKRKYDTISDDQNECTCTLNRKIVYNDDGQQVFQEGINLENHICPKKLKYYDSHSHEKHQNIEIEHENLHIYLPETIQELTNLLKIRFLKNSLRSRIIEKIKNIRQENLNMIRFDRESIIQKLKTNPEEVMDFKGTNISSLPGYPIK